MHLKHRHRFVYIFLLWFAIFPNFSFAQENILTFYPKAYAKTQNPPEEKKLIIIAEQKIDDKFATFIGVEKGKVLLAAVTKNKLQNPQKAFLLKPKEGQRGWELMHDLMKRYALDTLMQALLVEFNLPSDTFMLPQNVMDSLMKQDSVEWGYVFDRNEDARIDYVTFFAGAIPVKQKDFPVDYPKGGIVNQYHNYGKFTREQIQVFKDSWSFVFSHISDNNFDGKADAVIVEVMDPDRFWVDRWMTLSSSNFNGVIDTCWQFKDNIQEKERGCLKLGNGYWARRAGARKSSFGNEDLAKISELLSLLNQAANLSGLTKDFFYKE